MYLNKLVKSLRLGSNIIIQSVFDRRMSTDYWHSFTVRNGRYPIATDDKKVQRITFCFTIRNT